MNKKYIPDHAKKVFQGILFDTYHWEQKMFDGTTKTFEGIRRIGSTQIFVITENKKIIILKEEQPNVGKFISVPGGQIERNETPLQATEKELLEECGMKSNNLSIWKVSNSGGKIDWESHYYIAKNCIKIQEPTPETAGEKIKSEEVTFEEFIKYTQSKEFRNKMLQLEIYKMIKENELETFKQLLLN